MITIFRLIKAWQLKAKWKLVFWNVLDQLGTDIIQNPEKYENDFMGALAKSIHQNSSCKSEG